MPIGTAWNITKDIASLGKRIFDKKVDDEVRKGVQEMIDKSSELYDRVVFLEDERQANRQAISDLNEKIKRAKNFKREFKKYKPYKMASGAFVYALDESVHGAELPHKICTQCVSNEEISILQPKDDYCKELICHRCQSVFVIKPKYNSVDIL